MSGIADSDAVQNMDRTKSLFLIYADVVTIVPRTGQNILTITPKSSTFHVPAIILQ